MAGRKPSLFRRTEDRAADDVPFRPPFPGDGTAQMPFDALGPQHPLYLQAPATLKDPVFIRRLAAKRAEDLPDPMDLFFAALRHFSVEAYQDGTDSYRDGVGIRTRVARIMRGIGLRKLAKYLGIVPSRLSKWEHAQDARLTKAQISALAQRLDVSARWLRHADAATVPDFLRPWHEHLEGLNHDLDVYLASVNTARVENEVKALRKDLARHLGTHQPDPDLVNMLNRKPIVADFDPSRALTGVPTPPQDGPA